MHTHNYDTGLCMDVGDFAPRTPVIQYPCYNRKYTTQDWEIVGTPAKFNLRNTRNPNMCMDTGLTAAGSPILISWCHFEDTYESQKFKIITLPDTLQMIQSLGTLKCLDVNGLPGTAVHLNWCVNWYDSQSWLIWYWPTY